MDERFIATAFTTAFTIIDPLGMIPLSLAVTAGASPEARRRIVTLATAIAGLIILVMALIGRALFSYLGITLPAFTIAGGILLFLIAVDMLFARPTGAKQTAEEEREATSSSHVAVFPLAVPMIAGPGTIATVLVLTNLAQGDRWRMLVIFLAYASALLATWICMRAGGWILRAVGTTGIHVATRLLGILLAALAVQFVLNGLAGAGLIRHG
jgi:multiple antibiotic resistance protein